MVDDVDDPGHPRGIETRRRIVDDLDSFDVRRRDAVESPLVAKSGQARLAPIDKDRDAIAATQRDHAILVHGNARQVPHGVQQGPGRLRSTVVQAKDLRVDASGPTRFGRDGHLFGERLETVQLDVTQIEDLVQFSDEERHVHRVVAGKRGGHRVGVRGKTLDDEAAVLVGERASELHSGVVNLHDHGHEAHRCAVGGVQNAPGDDGASLLRQGQRRRGPLARKIRGVFRFRYRHKSPRVVQVQC